jgi:hypothetical protein
MTWNAKHYWAVAFVVVALVACATWAYGQPPQERRGLLGVLNWKQTETYPSVPWPSIPAEHTNALCITSDTPGKYPPTGVVTAAGTTVAAVAETPQVNYFIVAAIVAGGLVVGVAFGFVGMIKTVRGRARSKRRK